VSAVETYEVVVVKYGTRRTTRSDVYLNYPLYGEPDAPIEMDYFFWVARNDTISVVIDAGFSQAGGSVRGRTMLLDPREGFEALGISPSDAPTVVVTHAHYDHIGNLSHFAGSPIIVARREVEFWRGPHARRPQFHHSVEDAELVDLQAAVDSGRAVLFDDHHEVADGIEVRRVGGHTPGQSVVTVRTAQGVVLLASDAVHYYEELDRAMPFVSVANLVDMYDAFDVVAGQLDEGHASYLLTGHDPGTLERFGAVPGPVRGLSATIGRA
jgi:glyoxylase-like metal-dependent hydrolase (beta-lactamase superfamily II)